LVRRKKSVISLFSGAFGLDLGIERVGFESRVAVECNPSAAATLRKNRPDLPVMERRIETISTEELLDVAGLKVGEACVVTGGPSCQTFSTAGQRRSISDARTERGGHLFNEFVRVVHEARPRFFVMENVSGILSAAICHRPLAERGPGFPPLHPDELLGSALVEILERLGQLGYHIVFDLLNAADFGVPQRRERVIFVGSRDGEHLEFPKPSHSRFPSKGRLPWVTLRQALEGLADEDAQFSRFPPSKEKFLRHVPEGGNWRDLPARLQREALGAAYDSWGGRTGFCRRLAWDEASPALTSRPDSKATLFCHPTETRPLSVAEYKRLAQFPDDWAIEGTGLSAAYRQLGNAVPLGLGEVAGRTLQEAMRRRTRVQEPGVVTSQELATRLASRPRTILNPPRMRSNAESSAARTWLEASSAHSNAFQFEPEAG